MEQRSQSFETNEVSQNKNNVEVLDEQTKIRRRATVTFVVSIPLCMFGFIFSIMISSGPQTNVAFNFLTYLGLPVLAMFLSIVAIGFSGTRLIGVARTLYLISAGMVILMLSLPWTMPFFASVFKAVF